MGNRPKCATRDCNNVVQKREYKYKKNGKQAYRKYCCSCRAKRGGYLNNGKSSLYNGKCQVCGWDKASCDRHRIIYGCKNGKYNKGNVISLCPNCHRLVHFGLVTIK